MLEKNCLQRCIDKKKKFAERDFSSPPPPSRKIMVRPLYVSYTMTKSISIPSFAEATSRLPSVGILFGAVMYTVV